MITIDVLKAMLEIDHREVLTVGMANSTHCMFSFSPHWDGLSRTVIFTDGAASVETVLTGDTCAVPHEVLTTPGATVMLGFYGTDGKSVVLPTIWSVLGIVQEGADPTGNESADPSLPVLSQLLGMVGDLGDLATENKINLVAAINEVLFVGTPVKGVDYFTEQDKADLISEILTALAAPSETDRQGTEN